MVIFQGRARIYNCYHGVSNIFKYGLAVLLAACLHLTASAQQAGNAQQDDVVVDAKIVSEIDQTISDSQLQMVNSLLSLSETLVARREQLAELNEKLSRTAKEAEKNALQIEIDALSEETLQVEQNIDLVVLGLQARQYTQDNGEQKSVNLREELSRIFQPIVMSMQRATEPARRMEELRQLSEQAENRISIAQNTLDSINGFRNAKEKYPKAVEERLHKHYELWVQRLQEAQDLAVALAEQLAATQRARGNSLKRFSSDFGGFVLNRGVSLVMAIGLGLGFILVCQIIRASTARYYRNNHGGVLSASMRVFSMAVTLVSIIGGFVIAVTVFNIRQDWLMLAMSLLLALALSWTFMRSLAVFTEQARLLLNLGAVREGERTIVDGLPYRIERLSMYTKLVNPALKGGELIYPVRELAGMHSRPVTEGEAWFPTEIGDWIVRDAKHYQVINQTPEHVILRRPGGAEDFVPAQEFMDTLFEVITDGYRVSYEFGLAYQHLADARKVIPDKVNQSVREKITEVIGAEALASVDTRFVSLGDSALLFEVLVDMKAGYGSEWKKLQKYINLAVVEACLDNKWDIPFPQLVIHNPS